MRDGLGVDDGGDAELAEVVGAPAPHRGVALAAVRPTTGCGVGRSICVPSPSSPWRFQPQQRTAPSKWRAHM